MGCQQDDFGNQIETELEPTQNEIDAAFAQNFGPEITRDIIGRVFSLNGTALSGVTINTGNSSTSADSNGVFILKNANLNERFGFIKAEKAGFIHASRSIVPTDGTNQITIVMLPETIVGSTQSGEQATLELANGASVALEGNYINAQGQAYSGNVNVIMHHLDAAADATQNQMPGMLYARNYQGDQRSLQTYGMLAVELRGEHGEDLNLAPGTTAEIVVPVSTSLLAMAPATIPLWYFDETNGYWVEEGEARLEGDKYVGTVSHFSFWNCDIPTEAYVVCIKVQNENGNPITNKEINVTSSNFGTNSGITNHIGEACGFLPANEILTLEILFTGNCAGATYTETIGPFSQDASVLVTIPSNILQGYLTETVVGTLQNCANENVSEGFVLYQHEGDERLLSLEDGLFSTTQIHCGDNLNFRLKGFDTDTNQDTGFLEYNFTNPLTDVGIIATCNEIEEFYSFKIDDYQKRLFTSELFYVLQTSETMRLKSQNVETAFVEIIAPLEPGEYNLPNNNFELDFTFNDPIGFNMSNINTLELIIQTINYSEVGEPIDVEFYGTFNDSINNPHTIVGEFHRIRPF